VLDPARAVKNKNNDAFYISHAIAST